MTSNSQDWQKLSPFALVYFIVHFFFRFIKDGLLNILPPFAVILLQVENKLLWFSIGATGFIIAVVLYATLFYMFFRYKLTKDEVLLQRGVLKKEQLNLNFARIQNVNLSTPLYFSPFNLVNAQLDAAGSKGQEVVLAGIDRPKAELLRQEVFSYAKEQTNDEDVEQHESLEEPSLTLQNSEVAKFGLFSSTIFLAFAVLAPFQKQLNPIIEHQLVHPLSQNYSSFVTSEKIALAFAVISIVLSVILIMLLISSIASLLRFYNFELLVEEEKIKRTCGLLERVQFSLQKSKIQSIEVKQNWAAKLLNRYTLNCKQINNSTAKKAQKQQSLVVPVLTKQQVNSVLDLCWGETINLDKMNFTGISIRFFHKTLIFYVLLPAVVAFTVLFNQLDVLTISAILAYLLISTGMSYLRYRRYGYAIFDNQVVVRKGLFGVSYKVFKKFKIQQVSQIQTPMMKKNNVASLRFTLASGNITIPYIPQNTVRQEIDQCAYLAECVDKNWM